ncbi:hypothetical protein GQ53DRAFT_760996 [Thozetella sp. PMI_491]|nr:hypothetical protein GQ53DRAFT_760996 [Thozetella sp. PMI_491]
MVIHDKDAAVKYFSWDSNSFGGALIWASDLDDYNWTAHEGLFGKAPSWTTAASIFPRLGCRPCVLLWCGRVQPWLQGLLLRARREHAIAAGKTIKFAIYTWQPSSRLFLGEAGKSVLQAGFRMLGDKCGSAAVEAVIPSDIMVGTKYPGFHTEHSFEKQIIKKFWETAVSGVLPSGAKTKASAIAVDALINLWMKDIPGASSLPLIGTSKVLRTTPNDQIFEAVGSTANRIGQFLVQENLNRVKGNLFSLVDPIGDTAWSKIKSGLVTGQLTAEKSVLQIFAAVPGSFNYFNHPLISPQALLARTLVHDQWQIINDYVPDPSGIYPLWKEFLPDYHGVVATRAKNWLVGNAAMPDQVSGRK